MKQEQSNLTEAEIIDRICTRSGIAPREAWRKYERLRARHGGAVLERLRARYGATGHGRRCPVCGGVGYKAPGREQTVLEPCDHPQCRDVRIVA